MVSLAKIYLRINLIYGFWCLFSWYISLGEPFFTVKIAFLLLFMENNIYTFNNCSISFPALPLQYTPAIDIWSIGCIFAEMLTGKPLFPGKNVVHQLDIMTDLLGTPPPEAIAKVFPLFISFHKKVCCTHANLSDYLFQLYVCSL